MLCNPQMHFTIHPNVSYLQKPSINYAYCNSHVTINITNYFLKGLDDYYTKLFYRPQSFIVCILHSIDYYS